MKILCDTHILIWFLTGDDQQILSVIIDLPCYNAVNQFPLLACGAA